MSWNEGQDAGCGACDVCGERSDRVWHKTNKSKWKETRQSCMSNIRSQQTFAAWWNEEGEGKGEGKGKGKGEGKGKGGASSRTGDYSEYDVGFHAGIDHVLEMLTDLIGEVSGMGVDKGKGKGKDTGRSRSRSGRSRRSRSRSKSWTEK